MNREQAKELLPIMKAFAEGKTILCRLWGSKCWAEVKSLSLSTDKLEYRIKSEPKYRPFKDAEECWQEMQKHQPFGWIKDINHQYLNIITLSGNAATTFQYDEVEYYEYQRLINEYTFADGEPFGIKE